jgi:hypothetical protein
MLLCTESGVSRGSPLDLAALRAAARVDRRAQRTEGEGRGVAKNHANPMPRILLLERHRRRGDLGLALRCQARCKHDHRPCRQPAMRGKRVCRMHGGKGGAPKGARNGAFRHGGRTQRRATEDRRIRDVVRRLHAVARSVELSVRELRPLFTPIRYVVERVRVSRGDGRGALRQTHPHPPALTRGPLPLPLSGLGAGLLPRPLGSTRAARRGEGASPAMR